MGRNTRRQTAHTTYARKYITGGYGNGISKQELKPYVRYMRGKYHLYYHMPILRRFL